MEIAMDALNRFTARQTSRRISLHRSDDHDGLVGCDTAPPNRHAQRRGFLVLLMLACVIAAVGLIGSTMQGVSDLIGAFPNGAAVFQAGAWDKFFAGVGRIALLVLLCVAVVMVVRWRKRRAKRVQAK
jgi:hypothetical protein